MIRSCCHSLGFVHYLARTFATLDSLLESLLQAWDHFWSTLATFFEQKNDLRRQRCHQRCQREIFPTWCHFLGPHLGVFFARFLVFCRRSSCFFHCVFKAVFLCSFLSVFEQMGTVKTIKNTAQGSKNSECRQLKKTGPGPGLGWILESILGSSCRQMWLFCWKNECKKTSWKKVPPKSETTGDGHVQGLPDSPPKAKDCLSNKQQLNKKQQQ